MGSEMTWKPPGLSGSKGCDSAAYSPGEGQPLQIKDQ